ncbi:unnamed protein product [Linum trigynum]|uniref:Uncharacterized protein n=1 Tax=Linum trigynum TaxID=586398 RepID=A0AAV2D927_9ROSI
MGTTALRLAVRCPYPSMPTTLRLAVRLHTQTRNGTALRLAVQSMHVNYCVTSRRPVVTPTNMIHCCITSRRPTVTRTNTIHYSVTLRLAVQQ